MPGPVCLCIYYQFSGICCLSGYLYITLLGVTLCVCLFMSAWSRWQKIIHLPHPASAFPVLSEQRTHEPKGKSGSYFLAWARILQSSKFSAGFSLLITALCDLKDTVEIAMGTQRMKEHTPRGKQRRNPLSRSHQNKSWSNPNS